ncbi:hypothetical protein F5883DRAFT_558060 [Diaporthe sp. PMI_573]|nr:hypothetical protein F5883DRAFT_558060 [Diaporthaceae sp. PMI_573]
MGLPAMQCRSGRCKCSVPSHVRPDPKTRAPGAGWMVILMSQSRPRESGRRKEKLWLTVVSFSPPLPLWTPSAKQETQNPVETFSGFLFFFPYSLSLENGTDRPHHTDTDRMREWTLLDTVAGVLMGGGVVVGMLIGQKGLCGFRLSFFVVFFCLLPVPFC